MTYQADLVPVCIVGGGGEFKKLAEAAEELQATGKTTYHELAAFSSWGQVEDYVNEDAAGADLAVAVDLINEWGADSIVNAINGQADEKRAKVTVSTAHKANDREWHRVRPPGPRHRRAGLDQRLRGPPPRRGGHPVARRLRHGGCFTETPFGSTVLSEDCPVHPHTQGAVPMKRLGAILATAALAAAPVLVVAAPASADTARLRHQDRVQEGPRGLVDQAGAQHLRHRRQAVDVHVGLPVPRVQGLREAVVEHHHGRLREEGRRLARELQDGHVGRLGCGQTRPPSCALLVVLSRRSG